MRPVRVVGDDDVGIGPRLSHLDQRFTVPASSHGRSQALTTMSSVVVRRRGSRRRARRARESATTASPGAPTPRRHRLADDRSHPPSASALATRDAIATPLLHFDERLVDAHPRCHRRPGRHRPAGSRRSELSPGAPRGRVAAGTAAALGFVGLLDLRRHQAEPRSERRNPRLPERSSARSRIRANRGSASRPRW